MNGYKVIYFILLFSLVSCVNTNKKNAKKIYQNRIEVLEVFENISISKRNNFISLSLYNGNKVNDYLFEESGNKKEIKLVSANESYSLAELHKTYLLKEEGLEEYLKFYLIKKDQYDIQNITKEFMDYGISLKLYLKDVMIFYVPNKEFLKDNWLKLINRSNKLDDYWYWIENSNY